jgi:tetratricopeptide (TPR) repeat protein
MFINGRQRKPKVTYLILVSSLLLILFLNGCSSFNEHLAMKDAASFYKQAKWEDAAKKFEEALRINPYRAENWKHLGFCYWNMIEPGSTAQKDMDATRKALDAFQKYLQIVKKDDSIQDYIINLYINQNLLEEGVKYYEEVLKDNPQDTRVLFTLSQMYGKMGNFDKSLEYSLKKADLTPNDPAGYIYIAALCWQRSYNRQDSPEVREAIVNKGLPQIDKAIQLDPKNSTAYVYKGLLYRQLSETSKLRAEDEKDRRKKKELLDLSEQYLTKANEVRDIAIKLRKEEKEKSEAKATE